MDFAALAAAIGAASGQRLDASSARRLGGGSINEAWRFDGDDGPLFVKLNAAERCEMFAAEAAGLAELMRAGVLRVPRPIATGVAGGQAFLALEYLELSGGDDDAARRLGASLARLHAQPAEAFGWHRDNTIGSTPQRNERDSDWLRFFARRRLGYQFELAREAGASRLAAAGAKLCTRLAAFFAGAEFSPCLVHGDLWGGNWGAVAGTPVVFDPAVYYGDPETDIAMTELFGGFPPSFYAAYRAARPERAGDRERRELYRLYHVVNHYNLFGGGYGRQALAMVDRLLALS